MGACGSKDIPSKDAVGSPRALSRWKAYADDANRPAETTSSHHPLGLGSDVASDITLNAVVAYLAPVPSEQDAPVCVTGWEDGSLKWINWKTRSVVMQFQVHSRAVNRIVVGSRTGNTYSCSRDTTVSILPHNSIEDSGQKFENTTLSGHTLNVSTIAVDGDETSLCSGGRDTQTMLWDLATARCKAKNTTAQNVITCSKWIPCERIVAQGSEDLSVKVWDERQGLRAPVQTLRGYIYFPLCLDVSNDGNYLLTSSKGFNGVGCEARVWDRRIGKQLRQLDGHEQDATSCCFLPVAIGSSSAPPEIPPLVTASKDGTVKVWDASTSQMLCEAFEPSGRMFTSVSPTGDGCILASTLHGNVHVFKLDLFNRALELQD